MGKRDKSNEDPKTLADQPLTPAERKRIREHANNRKTVSSVFVLRLLDELEELIPHARQRHLSLVRAQQRGKHEPHR